MLIDKKITDIISGYDDILQAETILRIHWRPKLLAAYAQRKKILERESNTSRIQQIRTLITGLLGFGFILIGIGFSCRGLVQPEKNIWQFCCSGPVLIMLGLLILGAIWFSQKKHTKNNSQHVPVHPLRSGPLQRSIYPNLRNSWMEGLSGKLEDEVLDFPDYRNNKDKDHGSLGERIFIQSLHKINDKHSYVIANLMQHPREDIDIIMIGPKGVWVFEVKHWGGEIFWDDQGWRRVQTNYERGGVEVIKQPDVDEPPDQKWIRVAAQVSRTLQSQASDVLTRYPALKQVRGGIVFTKEEAIFRIEPGRPVFWGSLNFWIKNLDEIEPKHILDTRSILQLVEILLTSHQELTTVGQMRSMQDYAKKVVQEAEERLDEWVQM